MLNRNLLLKSMVCTMAVSYCSFISVWDGCSTGMLSRRLGLFLPIRVSSLLCSTGSLFFWSRSYVEASLLPTRGASRSALLNRALWPRSVLSQALWPRSCWPLVHPYEYGRLVNPIVDLGLSYPEGFGQHSAWASGLWSIHVTGKLVNPIVDLGLSIQKDLDITLHSRAFVSCCQLNPSINVGINNLVNSFTGGHPYKGMHSENVCSQIWLWILREDWVEDV